VLEGINTTTLNSARDEISEVIADSFEQGLTSAETAERIKDAVYDVSGVRISNAGMISRTEIGSITQMAKLEAYRAEEVEYWEWITARDDKVRDTHLIDGEVVRVGEPFSNGLIMPLDPDGSPDEVCNCFLGDMVPESPNGISKVFRNWYQGDIITLNFADGFDITGTPKHPILTRDGWVPLGELQKGDQVLKFFNAKDSRFGDVNIKHMVPQFSELYNSFSKVGTAMRIPGINVNFHGDFSASEVDVVGVGSHLWDESDSVFLKEQADLILSEPDLRKRMLSLQSLFYFGRDPRLFGHTADSLMGSRAEGTSLLRGGLIHSEEHGVTPISYNNTGSNKSGTYSTTGHPIFGSDSFLGHASKIVTGDRHVVEAKVTGRHVKTSVEREVFNLESHTGIYICNDVIVHNCRCLTVFANNPSGGN
jgi:SPP1 gp7 family putative phage head morphogenesis protein